MFFPYQWHNTLCAFFRKSSAVLDIFRVRNHYNDAALVNTIYVWIWLKNSGCFCNINTKIVSVWNVWCERMIKVKWPFTEKMILNLLIWNDFMNKVLDQEFIFVLNIDFSWNFSRGVSILFFSTQH